MEKLKTKQINVFYTDKQLLSTKLIGTRLALLPQTLNEIARFENNQDITTLSREQYRRLISEAYTAPKLRKQLMDEIDTVTKIESITAAEQEDLSMDILIIGTGPTGVSVAGKMREKMPSASILMVDNRSHRGGQFAQEEIDYPLNSPNFGGKLGFPGELVGPNNLGDSVLLQAIDISESEYPLRSQIADVVKIDGFLLAPAITDLDVTSSKSTKDDKGRYEVNGYHKILDKKISLHPKILILATGQGTPKYGIDLNNGDTANTLEARKDAIFNAESFRVKLANLNPQEVLELINKGIAFIGGRDSTNISLEGIISKLSEILSVEEIQQLCINVYGAKYGDSKEFEEKIGTHRYDKLIPYIGNLIQPHKDKATHIVTVADGKVSIGLESGKTSKKDYRTIIFSTGYDNIPIETVVQDITDRNAIQEVMGINELEAAIIAKKVRDEDIYIVGVAVNEQYPDKIPRFARSIRRHTPRVTAVAEELANKLAA